MGLRLVELALREAALEEDAEVRRVEGKEASANSDSAVGKSLFGVVVAAFAEAAVVAFVVGVVVNKPACLVRAVLGEYGTKASLREEALRTEEEPPLEEEEEDDEEAPTGPTPVS